MLNWADAEFVTSAIWKIFYYTFVWTMPSTIMVLFMGKMSFNLWSKQDPWQEARSEVTYMDREVAANRFDRMRPTMLHKFANYEHNCPDLEHSYDDSHSSSSINSRESSGRINYKFRNSFAS